MRSSAYSLVGWGIAHPTPLFLVPKLQLGNAPVPEARASLFLGFFSDSRFAHYIQRKGFLCCSWTTSYSHL